MMRRQLLILCLWLALALPSYAGSFAVGQVTLSAGTPVQTAPGSTASVKQRNVLIDNHDATNSIWVGSAASVTSTTGKLVRAGQSISITTSAAVYVVSSATVVYSFLIENE